MRRVNGGDIRPLLGIAAGVAVLLFPLSACGVTEPETKISEPKESSQNNGSDTGSNTAGSTPAPEDTPAPDMPPLPPAAEEKSDDGAAAFAGYYIDLWRRSIQTDSFDDIRAYTSSDCGTSCEPMLGPSPGHYVDGGELLIVDSDGFEQQGANRWGASVVFTLKAGKWVPNTPDASPEQHKLQDAIANLRLEYREGTWKVLHVEFDA